MSVNIRGNVAGLFRLTSGGGGWFMSVDIRGRWLVYFG